MFNSAISILKNYLDNVTPYSLYSIEMEGGENPEDLYYLCDVGGSQYIVFETDYISETPYQANEATQIFASAGAEPSCWLVKKTVSAELTPQPCHLRQQLLERTTRRSSLSQITLIYDMQ